MQLFEMLVFIISIICLKRFILILNGWLLMNSTACKTPLKFLMVKLLWQLQIYENTEIPGEKYLPHDSTVVRVRSEVKQRSERSQRFRFNSSEVKQHSEHSQRFPFNSSEVKQPSECSQRYHFNSIEVKQCNESSQRFRFNSGGVNQHSEHSQRFHFNNGGV